MLIHLLRTVAMVIALAVGMSVIVYLAIKLAMPPWIALVSILLFFGLYIWQSARWHAYWAPVSIPLQSYKWKSDSQEFLESVIEKAQVHAAGSSLSGSTTVTSSQTLRISIYNRSTQKRIKRIMIGDDAEYLCTRADTFWFYIHDRFHARIDGLVGYHRQTGNLVYHLPKEQISHFEKGARTGEVEIHTQDGIQQIDLAKLTAEPTTSINNN